MRMAYLHGDGIRLFGLKLGQAVQQVLGVEAPDGDRRKPDAGRIRAFRGLKRQSLAVKANWGSVLCGDKPVQLLDLVPKGIDRDGVFRLKGLGNGLVNVQPIVCGDACEQPQGFVFKGGPLLSNG